MELQKENQLQLALATTTTSLKDSLDSQKELFRHQIDQLQNIVLAQCNLTGVNPLSQEMAAGALSIKIGKRPRDLLNPKAIKYMQSIFSIKDAITKRECREISALFGVTATQAREFFSSQRTRVRKFVRLSKEKETKTEANNEENNELPCSDPNMPINQVLPINSVAPISVEEPSLSAPDEAPPGADESEKLFVQNIFSLMRKEESFTGQEKLMEWILTVQNSSVLCWFLTKGGVMILATWLTQAAAEEQTSILHIVLKVLCHLPLHKALPVHMSAILQSVNKLRFYKSPDVSNRARVLLARWSKIFARSQAMRKPNPLKSSSEAQDEMLLKQSIGEIMEIESWELKNEISEGTPMLLLENTDSSRKFESPQPLKMLTSADDSNKKLIRGAPSSQNRERRKVQLVEAPGQKSGGRNQVSSRSSQTIQSRPLSADDIQKAKMRAQFMQNKHGKASTSTETNTQTLTVCSSSQTTLLLTSSTTKVNVRPRVEEIKKSNVADIGNKQLEVSCNGSLEADEPPLKKMKMIQIPWRTPPEIRMSSDWSVGSGENSKEVEIQKNRLRREKETFYRSTPDIPSNPNEPWDTEMEYDDTLTPQIPTEQLPDIDTPETPLESPRQTDETTLPTTSTTSTSQNGNLSTLEPDLELLAVLLKNPELVMALTSGQNGNLSSQETIRLLDMIKANGSGVLVNTTSLVGGITENVEVSLPSPTPSTDTSTVAGGWNQEFTKNPFSRQIASSPPVMAIATTSRLVQPQIQQPISHNLLSQQKQTVPVNRSSVLNMNNYSHSNIALQQSLSGSPSRRIESGVRPPQAQYHMNPSSRMYTQPQPHQQMHHQNSSWMTSANHNNYTAYGNHPRERSGSMGESGAFESWSPDNSPVRQTGQPGWNYGEPRTNFGHSYRPDRSRYRNPNQNPNPNPNPNPYPNGNWRDDRRR